MINKSKILALFLFSSLLVFSICNADEKAGPLSVSKLMFDIAQYEKKEVSLLATVAGGCNSGCKIWVADGKYEKGAPVALVWAKDKAFTFKANVSGKEVLLKGYAVGKFIDLCDTEKDKKNADKKAETGCNPIIETESGKKQLSSITFFATSVEYL